MLSLDAIVTNRNGLEAGEDAEGRGFRVVPILIEFRFVLTGTAQEVNS